VLAEQNNIIIANFILELENNDIIDTVYEIKLNNKNKCFYFKQWYMMYSK